MSEKAERIKSQIRHILRGIDQDGHHEGEDPYCAFWETSTGVKRGKKMLQELMDLIDREVTE